jgi:hypothetical protein
MITSRVTAAAPHHLVADAGITSHRRWRSAEAPHRPLLSIGRR